MTGAAEAGSAIRWRFAAQAQCSADTGCWEVLQDWVTRLMLEFPSIERAVLQDSEYSDAARMLLGLTPRFGPISRTRAITLLEREAAERVERKVSPRSGLLFENVAKVGELLDLSDVEEEVLAFGALASTSPVLTNLGDFLTYSSDTVAINAVACALDRDPGEVGEALSRSGMLASTGLIQLASGSGAFHDKLSVKKTFGRMLVSKRGSLQELMSDFFHEANAPELVVADFEHAMTDIQLADAILRSALRSGRAGTNVLLYGPTGTGKTQLAMVLASRVGMRLFAVRHEDDEGRPATAVERLSYYQLCQRMLAKGRLGMVLFDEVEDVFGVETMRISRASKAWLNHALETNPVPAIWVSNNVDDVDPAYLRRFSHVIELPRPGKAIRTRILKRYIGDLDVPDETVRKLAALGELSPALIENAAQVARAVVDKGIAAGSAMEQVVANSLRAAGYPLRAAKRQLVETYHVEYANTNVDLDRVLQSARSRAGALSMLLDGPPGCGKTAFVSHFARALERPLITLHASDVLSPWVGVTEQQFAEAFRRAEQDDAVLLIDEIDSFLSDRAHAMRSWEVSMVNELLVQIEEFKGVLACCTNFTDWLDRAALRRFTLRIHFSPLTQSQRIAMLIAHTPTDGEVEQANAEAALRSMNTLTPGDFEAVRRQFEVFAERPTVARFIERLAELVAAKNRRHGRAIGFVQ